MAKTVFTDGNPSQGIVGTIIPSAFLNAVFSARPDGLNQDGSLPVAYAADTGSANAYAINPSPALTQYITGMPFTFSAANANTGASTLNINGLGTKAIVLPNGAALAGGEIVAGQMVTVIYDGTSLRMMSEPANLAAFPASLAANGYVKLPGGLIIQWGTATTASTGAATVTFPLAFSTACWGVFVEENASNTGQIAASNINAVSASSFTLLMLVSGHADPANWDPASVPFWWVAIGK